ncbi:MAG: hypothetical protein IT336_10670 [Thermomicrobiales bacterium]|nr:hypothetical protein [Thermomicrobiales bacterium]
MRRQRHTNPHGPAAVVRESPPYYALWDIESGNSLGTYDSEPEVLSLVHSLIDANGPQYAAALDLSTEDGEGNATHLATGDALLTLLDSKRTRRAS